MFPLTVDSAAAPPVGSVIEASIRPLTRVRPTVEASMSSAETIPFTEDTNTGLRRDPTDTSPFTASMSTTKSAGNATE